MINPQIVQEWESWEHLILDDLMAIERKIQKFYSASSFYSCKEDKKEQFVKERLASLVSQSTGGMK